MGMILAGMTEGIGAGMQAGIKSEMSYEAMREKMDTARAIADAKIEGHSRDVDAKIAAAVGKGGGGGGDPDIQTPQMTDRLNSFRTGYGGNVIQQLNNFADTGTIPQVTQNTVTADEPSAAVADPSSVGAGGEDYSDATSRREQQRLAVQTLTQSQIDDPTFMAKWNRAHGDMERGTRASVQPKEYLSIAKGDGEYQSQGLIGKIASGAPDSTQAGNALILGAAKPLFDSSGVNVVDGSLNDLGKSSAAENNGKAAQALAEAQQVASGAIKPKDLVSYIDTTRKDLTSQLTDLRTREMAANKVLSDPLATPAQKTESQSLLESMKGERANISAAQKQLVGISAKVAGSLGLSGDGASDSGIIGVRNNNPGNLKQPGGKGFQTFDTPQAGVDAMKAQLNRYATGAFNGKPMTTLNEIISTYAPASDKNDTPGYIKEVAKKLGVAPDAKLNLQDPRVMTALSSAMMQREIGPEAAEKFINPQASAPSLTNKDDLRAESIRQKNKTASDLAAFNANPPAARPEQAAATPASSVKIGDVVSGFSFKGGNPNDQANWEAAPSKKVAASPPAAPAPASTPAPEERSAKGIIGRSTDQSVARIDDAHTAEIQGLLEGLKTARKALGNVSRSGDMNAIMAQTKNASEAYQKLESAAHSYFPQRAKEILSLANG